MNNEYENLEIDFLNSINEQSIKEEKPNLLNDLTAGIILDYFV